MTQTLRAPTPTATRRLALLDVLRGVAILGTLMTNVWVFTGPGAEWGVLQGTLGDTSFGSVPGAAESVFRLLADGKFLSMLTILFGAGLAIQYASAARRGQPWPGRYRWRALFLFGEGTVHFVLVFAWDVLMGYAVTALLVAWLLTRSERAWRRVMWWAAGLHLTVMGLLTLALATAPPAGGAVSPQVVDLYAHGSWADQIAFRLQNAIALRLEPVLTFFLLLFLFLLGVRLFRAGAFGADEAARRIRARMLAWGLGLGVPLSAAVALAGPDFFLLGRYGAAPLTAVGYIGLIGAVVDRVRRPGRFMDALTSVGRMALSGYVLQNVLCALVAYGIGLGLASTLGAPWRPWWVMGLWAAVSVVLLVFSTLWLRRFPAGPLESVQKWALRR
ncbi:DUF418 domain-containing protein [Streptomyces sp. WAC05374]|uniref:DUF418 domain-containing protein n=1 Tax=Streptomyces sp. WAC05374 TaxID=2487420 RepID=UPI000F88CCD6|nr:DUF418 domain-containing protein [Streptomyces sp. WAC05374]RST14398.1 DUF418 domain-containing protein [Streptomyces sp. WAC05374]TDF44715.1 DUF418 domain-containing protein [Streptomyces sp. WAC05374]TDF55955.1 DUF418 domain-containing protein [Streptomyces sp. WAC05374]TDF59872.1 DUF418 domain-containing protein [Streptomyces sp. WAC05374]